MALLNKMSVFRILSLSLSLSLSRTAARMLKIPNARSHTIARTPHKHKQHLLTRATVRVNPSTAPAACKLDISRLNDATEDSPANGRCLFRKSCNIYFQWLCVLMKILLHGSAKKKTQRANVCSPNILRTVRRTTIRFLIELLVRRTWYRTVQT